MRLFYILCLLCWSLACQAKVEVYFSPSRACEKEILSGITHAQKTIDAAVYTFTHKKIAKALYQAHQRGIKVRILTDRKQSDYYASMAPYLFRKGVPIKINTEHNIEHNKFVLFDQNKLITGSYNWTFSASNYNSENCMVITEDETTLAAFQNRFDELWTLYDLKKSNRWFQRMLDLN